MDFLLPSSQPTGKNGQLLNSIDEDSSNEHRATRELEETESYIHPRSLEDLKLTDQLPRQTSYLKA